MRASQLVRLPLRLVPQGAVMRVLRGPHRGMRWIAGASTHGCWLGTYEPVTRFTLTRLIRPGDTVLDVGANVGFYTLMSSRLVGSDGRVIAFEPFDRNLQFLERHILINHLTNVEVKAVAVSDRTSDGLLFVGQAHESGSLVPMDHGLTPYKVKVVALDDWRVQGLLPHVDVIKMDIEGAEGRAVLGMRRLLAEDRPRLFIALHGGPDQSAMIDLLQSLNYELQTTDGASFENAPEIVALPASSLT